MDKAIAELGDDHSVRVTLLHPDVLVALAHRVITPNTTTIMMINDCGRYIDCTDYPASHYEALGERSQCDGYDTVFVNPTGDAFEARFAAALDDATWPSDPAMSAKRDRLIAANPPRLEALLAWIEQGR